MDESLLGDFISETQDLLQEMETSVLRLEENFDDKELIDDIFRSIHTIKEYLGMARIAEVAHKLENLLDLVRRKKRRADNRIVQLLMDTGDRITLLLQEVAVEASEQTNVDDLVAAIEALLSSDQQSPASHRQPSTEVDTDQGAIREDGCESDDMFAAFEDEDEELLAIFMEQFKDGYLKLQREIEHIAATRGAGDSVAGCIECISALRSSANYMGYDTLCRLYDQWIENITGAEAILRSNAADRMAEFIRTAIQPTTQRLAAIFPEKWIDFSFDITIPSYSGEDAVTDVGETDPLEELIEPDGFDFMASETSDAGTGMADIPALEEEELSLTDDLLPDMRSETETTGEMVCGEEELLQDFEEEYDRDLYEIFVEQRNAGLQAIHAELGEAVDGHSFRDVADTCLAHISQLKSSANYMGYDRLCALYDAWRNDIDAFIADIGDDNPEAGSRFVTACMTPWVRKIERLFEVPGIDRQTEDLVAEDVPLPPDTPAEHDATAQQPDTIPLSGVALNPDEEDLFRKLDSAFNAGMPEVLETNPGIGPTELASDLFSHQAEDEDVPNPPPAPNPETAIPADQSDEFPDVFGDMHAELLRMQLEPDPTPLSELFEMAPDPEMMESDETPDEAPAGDGFLAEAVTPFPFSDETVHPSKSPERAIKHNIRVDASKIDLLMNQVGELVVNRSIFTQLTNDLRSLQQYFKHELNLDKRELSPIKNLAFKLDEATLSLGRVANELQESVMKVRMLPISQLFDRYPRLIHDLTRKSDKKVYLDIKGADTELDRMVIEEISDPLVHIIRNAVDHGIETPARREASGKPESGTISIGAYHESNHVIIEISDDGLGLDLQKIRTKAVQSGIVRESEADRMTSAELSALITLPGFSTADQVTHTSGRGVGMDVVKKNIESLNGTLEIDTIPGKETRFRIKIPLTLAIFPALLVRVADEVYTIPLSAVEETIRIREEDITMMDGVEVIQLRDTPISLLPLPKLFNKRSQLSNDGGHLYVVVVNNGKMQVGLIVDELIRKEEVVIKPLEDYLQENSGFSGATILGDGQISLILDAYELVKITLDRKARMAAEAVI